MARNYNIPTPHASETDIETTIDINEVARVLVEALPHIAEGLMRGRGDNTESANQTFAEKPDDILEHEPLWHQFGIITHSLRAEQAYREEIPNLLQEWGIDEPIVATLSQEVEGISRRDLLRITFLLHDVGKFTSRRLEVGRGRFKGHEADSGTIIRQEGSVVNDMLTAQGFTDAHIDYIATCASLHFELGKMREVAKDSPLGYTLAFIKSPHFQDMTKTIAHQHPNFAIEIGMLFLADNLSKVDLRLTEDISNDAAIESHRSAVERKLTARNLPASLAAGVLQLPVNIAVAHAYLKAVTQADTKQDSGS